MTITTVAAYFLIAIYFVIERLLRKGKQALSLKPGLADASSSLFLCLGGTFSILLVAIAPLLNAYQIGYWETASIGWAGVILMLSGIAIRYWAAKTLGEFYTRTLQIIEGQEIVTQAPYSIIRHPGYLGTSLMGISAGFAVRNWIVLLALIIIESASKAYRIKAEEKMLEEKFGEQYKDYSSKTRKLVPYIY